MKRMLIPILVALAAVAGLAAQSDSGVQVYHNVLKSTVWIISNRGGGTQARGSGSLIDRRRQLILTNYHVVGDIDRATVYFPAYRDGKVIAERDYYTQRARGIRGTVKARDPRADLALIQIDSVPEGGQALNLASQSPEPGQSVHSIGNPGGSGALWLYTPGKVRAVYQKRWQSRLENRDITFEAKVVETDSATNHGDSGGPLANDKGELVGVTQGGSVNAQLISTFIDVTEVQRFLHTQKARDIPVIAGNREPERERPGLAVKDGAQFFSAEAIAKANEEIKRLAHRFGRDLLIETYSGVPTEDADKVRALSGADRPTYFRKWAQKRAQAERANGVTVLICREPTYLYVNVAQEAKGVFDDAAERRLREELLSKFRERKYDEGLFAAVRAVSDKLSEQKP